MVWGFFLVLCFEYLQLLLLPSAAVLNWHRPDFIFPRHRRTLAPQLTSSGILYPTRSNSSFLTRTVALLHDRLGFLFGVATNLAKALI